MVSHIALKESFAVVHALEDGEQVILLRKGGIRDPQGEFQLKHREFLLYPAAEHAEESFVRSEWRARFQKNTPAAVAGEVEFRVYAGVAWAHPIRDLNALAGLESHHIWTPEFLEKRMRYRPLEPTLLAVVRAYRLARPIRQAVLPEYAGCKSWVPLAEPVSLEGAEPVMDNRRFRAALEKITAVLK